MIITLKVTYIVGEANQVTDLFKSLSQPHSFVARISLDFSKY